MQVCNHWKWHLLVTKFATNSQCLWQRHAKCSAHTWYLSQTPQTASVEKKLVMWRNSPHDMLSSGKFLHMINVGKLCHMGKFLHITNVGKICQVENFSTWERWRKSVMWRNFSSWEMWRKYVKSALSNCLKMALYHQGQQIRLLSNQGAQGGTAQPTFLLLILLLDLSSPSALQNTGWFF